MQSLRWYLVVFVGVIIALVGGAVFVEQTTIDGLLHDDAVSTGRTWTEYVRAHVDDLDSITAGHQPSAQSQAFFDAVVPLGRVASSPRGMECRPGHPADRVARHDRPPPAPGWDATGHRRGDLPLVAVVDLGMAARRSRHGRVWI